MQQSHSYIQHPIHVCNFTENSYPMAIYYESLMICIIATIQYTITLYIQVVIVLVLQKVENIIGNHTHVCSYHAVILVMQYNSYILT